MYGDYVVVLCLFVKDVNPETLCNDSHSTVAQMFLFSWNGTWFAYIIIHQAMIFSHLIIDFGII
jgi:hypothetical protein